MSPCLYECHVSPCLYECHMSPCLYQCPVSPCLYECHVSPCLYQCHVSPCLYECHVSPCLYKFHVSPCLYECHVSPCLYECHVTMSMSATCSHVYISATCCVYVSFSFSFSSRWHRSARKGPYALRPVSQQSPQGCPRNSANICLVEHRSFSTLEGGMSAASFLHSSFLQAVSAVMLWLVRVEKVPQASEYL